MRPPLLLLAPLLTALAAVAQTPAPDLKVNASPEAAALNPALPTLFIAGDSTAAKGRGETQEGWGEPFGAYFDPAKVNIANRAHGGTSSRTYFVRGDWAKLIADVKAGDWLYTSGIDGLYPAGIPVAQVMSTEPPRHTPFAKALCRPIGGVGRYRHVVVLNLRAVGTQGHTDPGKGHR